MPARMVVPVSNIVKKSRISSSSTFGLITWCQSQRLKNSMASKRKRHSLGRVSSSRPSVGVLLDHLQRADDRLVGRGELARDHAREDVGGEVLELVRDESAERRLDAEGPADREGLAGVRDGRVLDPEPHPAVQEVVERGAGDLPDGRQVVLAAGGHRVARRLEAEALPAVLVGVVEDDLVAGLEGLVPGGERLAGLALELLVGAPHDPEGVLVEAEPDVQPVLLDPHVVVGVAPAGALAAEAPAELVDGDVVLLAELLGARQLIGGDDGGNASAEDGDLLWCGHASPRVVVWVLGESLRLEGCESSGRERSGGGSVRQFSSQAAQFYA